MIKLVIKAKKESRLDLFFYIKCTVCGRDSKARSKKFLLFTAQLLFTKIVSSQTVSLADCLVYSPRMTGSCDEFFLFKTKR